MQSRLRWMVDTPPAQMTRIYEDGDDNDGDDDNVFGMIEVSDFLNTT